MAESIVVPIDLSEPSLNALKFAASLARRTGRGIDTVFAVSATRVSSGSERVAPAKSLVGELTVAAKKALLESLASLDKSIEVQGVVRQGAAAEVIEAYVKEREASLLVMGTHGRTGMGRWVIGSVAERVIRTVDTPTLVVPASCEAIATGPVVLAYDFSDTSRRALLEAQKLAVAMTSHLHVVHIYADPWADQRAYHESKGHRVLREDIREKGLELGMQRLLEQDVAQVVSDSSVVTTVIRKGVAHPELIAYSDEVGANILALGSTGKSDVERALLGSTAQSLLRTAQRPLLVVH